MMACQMNFKSSDQVISAFQQQTPAFTQLKHTVDNEKQSVTQF